MTLRAKSPPLRTPFLQKTFGRLLLFGKNNDTFQSIGLIIVQIWHSYPYMP